jgi:hypothetical protein
MNIEVAAAKVALAPFPTLSSNPRYLATLRSNASIYKGFLPRVGLGIAFYRLKSVPEAIRKKMHQIP